jgi:NAD(P)-dependent dehydrogenase (short-subunit alcohol dehydrogenase family)
MTTQTAQNPSSNTDDLAGAVALVTGATSGIGRATALALAARGARVLVHGRNASRGDQVISEIRGNDGDAEVLLGDLVAPAGVHSLARRAVELGGGHVDILVNNAGLYPIGGLTAETLAEDIDAAFAVNVRAPFLLVAELAPAMAARGQGAIVNVLTTVAQLGVAGLGLYGASKAALGLLTRSWAAEFGPQGVRVNAVSPGPTSTRETPQSIAFLERIAAQAPAGRVATPDEIASAISYLAGPGASFVQGTVLTVDGGRSAV